MFRISTFLLISALAVLAVALPTDDEWSEISQSASAAGDLESVDGYTCGSIFGRPTPCKLNGGGSCGFGAGILGGNCNCADGYFGQGYRCDWGPTDETKNGIVWTTERVKRVALAMDVAAGSYYDGANGELEQKCPALLADIDEFAAIDLSTWNTSAWNYNATVNSDTQGFFGVVPGTQSPSGESELIAGFRGTEFSKLSNGAAGLVASLQGGNATQEQITDLAAGGKDLFFSDLMITRHDLEYDGVSYGYVHAGVFDSVEPYITPLVLITLKAIGELNGIEGLDGPNAKQVWAGMRSRWNSLTIPRITITGHSLGAALATIWAAILKQVVPSAQIYLYTFASLRVGSPKFVQMLEASSAGSPAMDIIRFVNQRDVISMVPSDLLDTFSVSQVTASSLQDQNPVLHAGVQVTLNHNQVSAQCQDWYVDNTIRGILFNLNNIYEDTLNNGTGCWDVNYLLLTMHTTYQRGGLLQWLIDHGHTDAPRCTPYF